MHRCVHAHSLKKLLLTGKLSVVSVCGSAATKYKIKVNESKKQLQLIAQSKETVAKKKAKKCSFLESMLKERKNNEKTAATGLQKQLASLK